MIESHYFQHGNDSTHTVSCAVCGAPKGSHRYVQMQDTSIRDMTVRDPVKDLIDAAEELLEHYNEDPINKKYSYPTAERLRVAIAKARGDA